MNNADLENIQSGSMPPWNLDGETVLDIGCQNGEHLTRGAFAKCLRVCGIDPDAEAIQAGRKRYPDLHLEIGKAEQLPWHDETFSVIRSNVSLPYTVLNRSFAEAYRVLQHGGRVHFTMHAFRQQWSFFWRAVLGFQVLRVIDHIIYVWPHSVIVAWFGSTFARPWKRDRYESCQTRSRLLKLAKKAGFVDVKILWVGKHFVLEARKP